MTNTPLAKRSNVLPIDKRSTALDLESNAHSASFRNRNALSRELDQISYLTLKNGSVTAVCYLDIDRFKNFNDLYGYKSGDEFLEFFATNLLAFEYKDTVVSRVGGDDFVVVLSNCTSIPKTKALIEKLLAHARKPFLVDGDLVKPSVSIGATIIPSDSSDGDTLIRHASYAMCQGKLKGKNQVCIFDMEAKKQAVQKNKAVSEILKALANDEMVLHYQPSMDLITNDVLGFEALIRWQHPKKGLLQPTSFLPDINESPLIVKLDEWVIRKTFFQLRVWKQQGLETVVSVNVTSQSILHPDFIECLKSISRSYQDISMSSIQIEVLETSLFKDMTLAREQLLKIRKLGVSIALDDFGTGYSSLAYLNTLDTDYIKIDQSFVKGVLAETGDLAIVQVIIQLSKTFKMKVVAEGVESEDIFNKIKQLGCDIVQGYFLSKPIPPESVIEWLNLSGLKPLAIELRKPL